MDLESTGYLAGNINLGAALMSNTVASEQKIEIFQKDSWWLKACLLVMFLAAALIRFNNLKAPGHLLDREYTSAIFARAFYYIHNDDVADWEREIAITERDQQPILEPPLLEYLVSVIYRVMGKEDLYYSRYLTNAFWLIGGIFMFLIAGKLLSTDAAVIATGYYLFVPMGIIISRSFQPDSLMMMMYLISLYSIVLYFDSQSTRQLVLAGILTGLTLLLRPLVIFGIFFSFLALSIHRNRDWKKIIDPALLIFGVLSLLPSIIYYGYGIFVAGFMRWKVTTSFMPFLLAKKDFWTGWLSIIMDVAKLTPLLLAIPGFFLIRNKKAQFFVSSLMIAFLVFTVVFTYHIHTHPYYHIQLFPIVGLCLAPIALSILTALRSTSGKLWWVPISAVVVFSLYLGYKEVRGSLYQTRMESPATAREIGELIHHSARTVYVAFYYGLPLEYYGEFAGAPWPVRIEDEFYRRPGEQELSVQERIDGLGFVPEYFVITHFDLYNQKHQDLKEYLQHNCSLVAEKEKYVIYDACRSLATTTLQAEERSVRNLHR